MKCENCGLELPEENAVCPACSTAPVEETPVEAPAVEAAPVEEAVPAVEAAPAQESAPVEEPAPAEPAQPVVQVVQQVVQNNPRPALQLPTNRGMLKYYLLMLPTLCIYPLVIMYKVSTEINIVASRYDGKRTMNFLGMMMLAPLTLSIIVFVWFHNLSNRIGAELRRRGIHYKFSAGTYWLFNILWAAIVSFINGVVSTVLTTTRLVSAEMVILIAIGLGVVSLLGTFIYFHKLFKSMNLINADFNEKG